MIKRALTRTVGGIKGPVKDIVIDPEYLDIKIQSHSSFSHKVKPSHTVFAYVIEGAGYFDKGHNSYAYEIEVINYFDLIRDSLITPESLVIFAYGDEISISTADKPVRFLLISGRPIKEPIAWYSPIVMNTQEELRRAFEEYQKGTFIKHKI